MSTQTATPSPASAGQSPQGHPVVSRAQWLASRKQLLAEEKELTRRSDELARKRQQLPWVRVDKGYRFETEQGTVALADLFQGRSQLIVYHFMFGPDYEAGCPSCSCIADSFNGITTHLENHDVAFTAISRASLATLQAYKKRLGWSFPWASSADSDFNFDFNISFTDEQQRKGGTEYNYQTNDQPLDVSVMPAFMTSIAQSCGTDVATYMRDCPGMSCFIMEDDVIYHTYSAYSRGLDGLWSMYQWLDRAPKGRNETGPWIRRHDEYDHAPNSKESNCCCS